jgi:glycosyltransferase involved in cell wall biosynthesis
MARVGVVRPLPPMQETRPQQMPTSMSHPPDVAGETARSQILLSVVVPCYNEVDILERFYAETSAVLKSSGAGYEILLVDDGSRDATLDVIRGLAACDPHVRFISFSRNFGKESGMLAGLRHCRGDAAIIMDADLQHPPALIPAMLTQYRKGYQQVIAKRTRLGDARGRTFAARRYYGVMNRITDVELVDGAGDFRLLSRRAIDALISLPEYNRFSKGLFAWIGFEPFVIEYENVERSTGRSKWTFSSLFNYAVQGAISFNDRPLRAAIYLGSSVTLVSLIYAVWVIARTIARGVDVPGYATMITSILVLGGLQLLFLGVVGEYLGKVYYETKRRPQYIVSEDNLDSLSERR